MKKITLSLVAAGLTTASLGAYAATPTSAAPFQVVVPNLQSGLNVTLEGQYVQPTNSDLVYSYNTAADISGSSQTTSNSVLTPDYGLGFRVGLGYVFPNSGNDMQVAWTHFDQNTTAKDAPFGYSDSNILASSTASFRHDAVDLDMGQYLSMGTRFQARLFAGLRYANLKNDVTDTQTSAYDNGEQSSSTQSFKSKFEGVGPRVGIDTTYHVNDGLGVVAHFATALLVGRTESSATSVSHCSGVNNYASANQSRVVPAFDGKLGLNYTFGFNKATSNMTLEAGYQVTQYVNAIDRVTNPEHNDVYFNGSSSYGTTTSSVGFNGPYLNLNFKI